MRFAGMLECFFGNLLFAVECKEVDTEDVKRRHRRGYQCADHQDQIDNAVRRSTFTRVHHRVDYEVFAPEAGEWNQPGQGQRPSRLVRDGRADHEEQRGALDRIPNLQTRLNRLCEFNVIRQVRNVASDVFVQDAWARGQDLSVHGWVYSLANGLVTDLDVTVSKPSMIARLD